MRQWWIAFALCVFFGGASAQVVEPAGTVADPLACLQKGGPRVDYPSRDRQHLTPGFVRVSLEFHAPDEPPKVSILFRAASEEMLDEVRWHVRGYRLPCLPRGQATTAVQEFVFKPRDSGDITWTEPRALAAQAGDRGEELRMAACTRTPRTPPDLWGPTFDRREVNVIVEMTFQGPDREPGVKVMYTSASTSQVASVTDYVRQYRVPCMAAGGKPYVVQQQFTYRPAGAEVRVFKEAVKLSAFLSNVKGIRQMHADFDFKTMNCPFQVAWTLGKPAVDNRVGEVGAPDPNRAEFLAWLAGLQMNLSPLQFEQMLGQAVIINVPCGSLKLAPES